MTDQPLDGNGNPVVEVVPESHTPGPWRVMAGTSVLRPWLVAVLGRTADGAEAVRLVATLAVSPGRVEECEANGRLLAAAPDLLRACEQALCYLEFGSTPLPGYGAVRLADVAELRAAISKAKGA